MNGAKVAARGKNLLQAQPKDENVDTNLLTLPISARLKLQVILESGVTYGGMGIDFPIGQIAHGLSYAPLFRAWIETVNQTTGVKTGKKYSIPYVVTADIGFSMSADNTNLYVQPFISGLSTTPGARLIYDVFVYIFDSRYQDG